jgi:hypothetical protein
MATMSSRHFVLICDSIAVELNCASFLFHVFLTKKKEFFSFITAKKTSQDTHGTCLGQILWQFVSIGCLLCSSPMPLAASPFPNSAIVGRPKKTTILGFVFFK